MAMNADTMTTPSINLSFTASAALSDNLQRVLTDLIALELVGKQIHWNIVGPNFRDVHLNLDEVVDIAREGSDEVAERMRAINAVPDGRPATVSAATTVPAAPEGEILTSEGVAYIVSAIEAVVATLRGVDEDVDSEDPTSSGIVEDLIGKLEQQALRGGPHVRVCGPDCRLRGVIRRGGPSSHVRQSPSAPSRQPSAASTRLWRWSSGQPACTQRRQASSRNPR